MCAMPHLLNAFGEAIVVPSEVGSRYTFWLRLRVDGAASGSSIEIRALEKGRTVIRRLDRRRLTAPAS